MAVIKLIHTKDCNDSMMFIACLQPLLYPGEWSIYKDPDMIELAIETSHAVAKSIGYADKFYGPMHPLIDIECVLLYKHERLTQGECVIVSAILSDGTVLPPVGSSQVENQNIVLTTLSLNNAYKIFKEYNINKTAHIVGNTDDLELLSGLSNHLIYKEDFYEWLGIKKSFLEYIKVCVTPYSNLYSITKVNTPGSEFMSRDKSLRVVKDFWECWNANK
tara:strand:- start:866 stop:1522 length:657 start_codon:yes stop_codon:yes gene_type:complete